MANCTTYNGFTQGNTDCQYVLDYLDGNQFEKFKDYSYVGNLFKLNTTATVDDVTIEKDTYKLNSSGGVITRTPGASNTKARLTEIDGSGALNPTHYTKGTNGLAPCFRCD